MNNTISEINNAANLDFRRFIDICEEEYHDEIMSVAQHISDNAHLKVVMIAGPSGAGKTTSALLLSNYLLKLGIHAQIVSLDNFYLSRQDLPILPNGERDTESVNALDIKEMQHCFLEIENYSKTKMPFYDFEAGKSIKGKIEIDITNNGILIVEGLHALNPVITDCLREENLYKIYISVNEGIYNDKGDRVLTSRKIRFIRRTLRDEKTRGADINATLKLWWQVGYGEEQYLYCFKDRADILLKTLHPYELCVYKERFLKSAKAVLEDSDNYKYVKNITEVIKQITPINPNAVPKNSLIREFLGE